MIKKIIIFSLLSLAPQSYAEAKQTTDAIIKGPDVLIIGDDPKDYECVSPWHPQAQGNMALPIRALEKAEWTGPLHVEINQFGLGENNNVFGKNMSARALKGAKDGEIKYEGDFNGCVLGTIEAFKGSKKISII